MNQFHQSVSREKIDNSHFTTKLTPEWNLKRRENKSEKHSTLTLSIALSLHFRLNSSTFLLLSVSVFCFHSD